MRNFSSKTKANSPRNFNKRKLATLVVWIVLACLVLLLFRSAIGALSSNVTVPIYGVRSWFLNSSATIPSYFRDRSSLISEIKKLQSDNAALTARSTTFTKLLNENEKLRALLNIHTPDRIGAGVIARPPFLPYDALLIDKGSNSGIVDGAVVYEDKDHAIGFIAKTYSKSALVSLFTTPGVKSTVYVIGPDIYTTAEGQGGGVMRVSVPQGIDIAKGDTVVLPSIESGLLGDINIVESVPTAPEQNGYVTFKIPTQSIQFVSVSAQAPQTTTFQEAQQILEHEKPGFLHVDVPNDIIVNTEASTGTDSGASSTQSSTTISN